MVSHSSSILVCSSNRPHGSSESYVWLNLAAKAGNKNLAIKRDRAAEKLTTEELDLAQQRAAKLFEEIQQNKMN